jgi:YesN/AraC family two-component response regulator
MAELEIKVKDSGIGIPITQQSKIFERFYQVSESHKEVGTGIGLALVKELAELMNGKITLKSEFNKGSEFVLALPIEIICELEEAEFAEDEISVAPTTLSQNSEHEKNKSNTETKKPKLLIVEDNADLMKFVISSLGNEYEFLEAADGRAGLDLAIREIPELIVSDVMMPEMDGIEMTAKLKQDVRTSHVPIILLTAKASDENKLEGLATGADDYLTKPFNKNELALKVRNAIATQTKMRDRVKRELLKEGPKLEVVSADEKFLLKVRETILNRLNDEQLSVESLAEDIGLSRAQFYRKIVALTGMGVSDLIKSFRLQKAEQLLAQHWGPVSQVAYEVGFSNLSYFSKCFKEQFGVLPSEYQSKVSSN